jgi:negative regulator of sigma E activity
MCGLISRRSRAEEPLEYFLRVVARHQQRYSYRWEFETSCGVPVNLRAERLCLIQLVPC